ncbi:MAG: hypothetical protein E7680_02285 [Ruminococcaceae bacterium]|nr:hypothetical protein [Oscillospiraceae bacterium]
MVQIIERKQKKQLLTETLINLFPDRLVEAINACGAGQAEEIRLHADRIATVTFGGKNYGTNVSLSEEEIADLLSSMCEGSLYAYQSRICNGYISLPGGVRVGVCGCATMEGDHLIGVGNVRGLIIRLPHIHRVSATPIVNVLRESKGVGGALIFSPPGAGKTTCLRAAAKEASELPNGLRTVIVDTRAEFSETLEGENLSLDILVGYPHEIGIDIAVRTLGAELILCDEIGTDVEARAILSAANRGVPILASAHARSFSELLRRPSIKLLHRAKVFANYVKLSRNPFGGFDYTIRPWENANDDP